MHALLHVQERGNGVTLHTNDTTQGYAIYRVTRSSMYLIIKTVAITMTNINNGIHATTAETGQV